MSSWLDKPFLEPQTFIQFLINTFIKSVAEHWKDNYDLDVPAFYRSDKARLSRYPVPRRDAANIKENQAVIDPTFVMWTY